MNQLALKKRKKRKGTFRFILNVFSFFSETTAFSWLNKIKLIAMLVPRKITFIASFLNDKRIQWLNYVAW